jgi:hypothetical protein
VAASNKLVPFLFPLRSLEERISLAVHEIQDKRFKKTAAGPSTKEGRSLEKSMGRRRAAMMKLLDERCIWKVVGTNSSIEQHRPNDEDVKQMLRSGEGPGQSGAGVELYWGKLAHRCTSDLARCKEELPDQVVQQRRLRQWAERTLIADEGRLEVVSSGQAILLGRWKKLLNGLLEQLNALTW